MREYIDRIMLKLGYVSSKDLDHATAVGMLWKRRADKLEALHISEIAQAFKAARMVRMIYEAPSYSMLSEDLQPFEPTITARVPAVDPRWHACTVEIDMAAMYAVKDQSGLAELDYVIDATMHQYAKMLQDLIRSNQDER